MGTKPVVNMNYKFLTVGRLLLFFVLLFFVFSARISWAEPAGKKRIVVFTPTTEGNTYWPQVYRIWEAVASDLGIILEKHEFDVTNRFEKLTSGIKILREMEKPDGAIFSVAFGQSKPLVEVSEELGFPVILQGPVSDRELLLLGGVPRMRYKSWIAYFYQDEMEKGYLLARNLFQAARDRKAHASDGRIHAIGIGGDRTWEGSIERERGLMKALDEAQDVQLDQIIPTQWTPEEAGEKTAVLLKRYPETSVVWAASDQLGIGVSQTLTKMGYSVGQNAFTGGLDLSRLGLDAVRDRRLDYSVSSTMMLYAEILIYFYDYLSGVDFKDEVGTEIVTSIDVVNRDNLDYYLRLYDSLEQIDFKKFSKTYNSDLKKYDFSDFFK